MVPDRLPRHGTAGEYTKHGCRCDECREAQRKYMRAYRDRKLREKLGLSEEEWEQRAQGLAIIRNRTISDPMKLDLLLRLDDTGSAAERKAQDGAL